MKTTRCFDATRQRQDRLAIFGEWILQAVSHPHVEITQADGRIRRRSLIDAAVQRSLRVVLLPDGEAVHSAFFDRRFKP